MSDLIYRQDALETLRTCYEEERWGFKDGNEYINYGQAVREFEHLPAAQPEWIPFKTRELTDEEREEHPEWDCIIVGPLPDDGQRILVSINLKGHEEVQSDEFYSDDGSYLDSGYEIGSEAVAWMPLPAPWREEQNEAN